MNPNRSKADSILEKTLPKVATIEKRLESVDTVPYSVYCKSLGATIQVSPEIELIEEEPLPSLPPASPIVPATDSKPIIEVPIATPSKPSATTTPTVPSSKRADKRKSFSGINALDENDSNSANRRKSISSFAKPVAEANPKKAAKPAPQTPQKPAARASPAPLKVKRHNLSCHNSYSML